MTLCWEPNDRRPLTNEGTRDLDAVIELIDWYWP